MALSNSSSRVDEIPFECDEMLFMSSLEPEGMSREFKGEIKSKIVGCDGFAFE